MTVRRFNRYELKYLMAVHQAEAIVADLADLTDADPHSGSQGYRLVSLYYDSPGLDCFWAKIDGIKFRRKLRLRVYVGDDIEAVASGMVEIKQRINRTVQKRRLRLPLEEAERLCGGTFENGDLDEMDRQVVSEVQYMVRAMHLGPTCVTAYHRKAFVGGRYDAGLRITFDTDVRYRVHGLKVNLSAANKLVIPADWCIMEVKVNDSIPDWVTSLLARHGCQLRRVSKYCAGIALGRELDVLSLALLPPDAMGKVPSSPQSSGSGACEEGEVNHG